MGFGRERPAGTAHTLALTARPLSDSRQLGS